jgi:TolA-binding protein
VTFAKGLKAFPKGSKASANLLKMGTAFDKLGKNEYAKSSWEKLLQDFPESAEADKARAGLERLAKPQ